MVPGLYQDTLDATAFAGVDIDGVIASPDVERTTNAVGRQINVVRRGLMQLDIKSLVVDSGGDPVPDQCISDNDVVSPVAQHHSLRLGRVVPPATRQLRLDTSGHPVVRLHGECGDSSGDPSGTVAPSS